MKIKIERIIEQYPMRIFGNNGKDYSTKALISNEQGKQKETIVKAYSERLAKQIIENKQIEVTEKSYADKQGIKHYYYVISKEAYPIQNNYFAEKRQERQLVIVDEYLDFINKLWVNTVEKKELKEIDAQLRYFKIVLNNSGFFVDLSKKKENVKKKLDDTIDQISDVFAGDIQMENINDEDLNDIPF